MSGNICLWHDLGSKVSKRQSWPPRSPHWVFPPAVTANMQSPFKEKIEKSSETSLTIFEHILKLGTVCPKITPSSDSQPPSHPVPDIHSPSKLIEPRRMPASVHCWPRNLEASTIRQSHPQCCGQDVWGCQDTGVRVPGSHFRSLNFEAKFWWS